MTADPTAAERAQRIAAARVDLELSRSGPMVGVPKGGDRFAAWSALGDRHAGFLLEEVDRLTGELKQARDELAEERVSHNPRLRCLLVKVAPDRDLYVGWSNVAEMPAGVWTRTEAEAYGFPPSRLDRADANGSTDLSCGDGYWDDTGFVAEQRGWLRRERLGDYARLWLAGNQDAAFDLLEPFDGEAEVRRG